jgi:uncharacterized cupredoxin-like copper-binding protein
MRKAAASIRHALAPLALALLALLAGCGAAPSHRAAAPSDQPPVVRIIAFDGGYEMPARIGSGITEFRLINRGKIMHEGVFEHFLTPDAADANVAAFVDSVRAGIDVPASAEDSGGPGLTAPGDSSVAWVDLPPGRYGVTCWYADHLCQGMARDFEVVESHSTAKPPPADIGVKLVDFSYEFTGAWTAGTHRVLVENIGSEAHEFDPYRLEPGKTTADFTNWIKSHRKGPAPAIALGGSGTFQPGRRVWIPLTLTPGRYFAFCQMPAKIGGKPHYQMGMLREFEVK